MAETKDKDKELPDFNDVENGPMSEANRQCRDVFCCLIFLANIGAMIYLTFYAYLNGNPYNIYRGTAGGYICGQMGGAAQNFPYMYLYNLYPVGTSINTQKRLCVDECPVIVNGVLKQFNCFPQPAGGCTYNLTFNENGTASGIPNSDHLMGYPSSSQVQRVCVPDVSVFSQTLANVSANASSSLATALRQGYLADFITDVSNNWQWLLVGMGFAIVLSFIYMFLLRCFVGCIVWGSILGIFALLIGFGFVFLYNGGAIKAQVDSLGYLGIPTFATSDYYNIYGYVLFGIAGVFLILILCCCSRIRLAVAICRSAGQFVVGVYLIILVPVVMAIISLMTWAACLAVLVYLVSVATYTVRQGDLFTVIADYTETVLIEFYYFIFASLWCNALISAITTFVIASACCMWYYSHGPGQDIDAPILRSYRMAFRYHFGSLAFGSFILALVQLLQFLVEVFKKHAESTGQDRAPCFEYVLNCLRCCLACVERIVQFLNKTAYIQIALRGKNFCMAAKDGFEIVWSNGLRYAIVAGVGEIVMFIGKLLIAIGTTLAYYCLITFQVDIKSNILQPLFQLLVVFIIAYVVATIFMSVYSVAMDTLLACFIVDQINQKAKGGKGAVYAPEELAGLMDTD